VHLHPFYRERLATKPGMCPVAEEAYEEILSLPIFPRMSDHDVARVIEGVRSTAKSTGRKAA
jgi:perosamine synthetase